MPAAPGSRGACRQSWWRDPDFPREPRGAPLRPPPDRADQLREQHDLHRRCAAKICFRPLRRHNKYSRRGLWLLFGKHL